MSDFERLLEWTTKQRLMRFSIAAERAHGHADGDHLGRGTSAPPIGRRAAALSCNGQPSVCSRNPGGGNGSSGRPATVAVVWTSAK